MKFLGRIFVLFLGLTTLGHATQDNFRAQYVQPLRIQIFSSTKGVTREEHFYCTPQTCCFSEKFYCFMENGECYCDLHVCEEWPNSSDPKKYWMKMSGTDAEKYCGRPHLLHEATNLCLCDPDKNPPCDDCNPPVAGNMSSHCPSLPRDCRP
jgi:hypothetical protein